MAAKPTGDRTKSIASQKTIGQAPTTARPLLQSQIKYIFRGDDRKTDAAQLSRM